MTPATYQDLVAVLGEVDDLIVERILATGASLDDIGEALDQLEDEQRFGETHHEPSSPRVAEVRAILEEMIDDLVDQDEGAYPAA